MSKGFVKIYALALAVSILLCGCSGKSQETDIDEPETSGDSLIGSALVEKDAVDNVFSLNYEADESLNPISSGSADNMLFWSLMYDSLYIVDGDGNVSSELVLSYTTTDYSWWVFTLDTGIPFNDGSTLTAYDAAYSIRQAMSSEKYSGRLSLIYGVSALSEDTLAISTNYPDSQLTSLLNIPIIKNGSAGEKAPAGSGAYMLSENGDSLVIFDENRHADEMPIDIIYLKTSGSVSDKISAFEDAGIDLVTNDPTGTLNLGYGSTNETRYYTTSNMHYVGFNMRSVFFQSSLCRMAVNYIIDRDAIVEDCLDGAGVVSPLPVLPSSSLYDQNYASGFKYDPDTASMLFERANIADHDSDGKLEFLVTGIVVEINIDFIVNTESSSKVLAARRIAEGLNSIGITTNLRELDWDSYIEALEEGEYDMYYGEISMTADWNLAYLFDDSRDMNYANCLDTSYSDLYYAYLAADENGRYTAFQDACHYMAENGGLVPICFEKKQVLTHRNVVSGMSPNRYDIFYNFSDWTINIR